MITSKITFQVIIIIVVVDDAVIWSSSLLWPSDYVNTWIWIFRGDDATRIGFFEQVLTTRNTHTSPVNTKKSQGAPNVFLAIILQCSNQSLGLVKNFCHAFSGSIVTILSKDFNSSQEKQLFKRWNFWNQRDSPSPDKEVSSLSLDFVGLL